MKKYAVIVAGGSGTRMGADVPKQFLLLKDKPVIWYTLTAFLAAFPDMQIVLVLPQEHLSAIQPVIDRISGPDRIKIVAGGDTRFHSVQNGLKQVPNDCVVFVHDGVRCLTTPSLIQRCYQVALDKGNAIPAIVPSDTLRIEEDNANQLLDRNKVRIIQTPQTFLAEIIKPAFNTEYQPSFTDEATVVEKTGVKIHLIEGELNNIKITRPLDLLIAEKIIQ